MYQKCISHEFVKDDAIHRWKYLGLNEIISYCELPDFNHRSYDTMYFSQFLILLYSYITGHKRHANKNKNTKNKRQGEKIHRPLVDKVWCNYLSIPKLQRCNRWSLGMNK